ncbi:hypothetical protein ACRRTK_024640 [Alexandromys fortis]
MVRFYLTSLVGIDFGIREKTFFRALLLASCVTLLEKLYNLWNEADNENEKAP